MKITLPAQINPPRLRKDGSASISFDTRELNGEEIVIMMSLRNLEGWLCFSPNENEAVDTPTTKAQLDTKTPSERFRDVLFVLYKQETKVGKFTGLFETFYADYYEKMINHVKSKLT